MKQPKVVAVVVTYNSEKDIKSSIQSLLDQDYKNLSKIIVVDSASKDSTLDIVKQFDSPLIQIIASDKNLYFAGGNNLGIETAISQYEAQYIALLNPDAKADKNWISELIKIAISDESIGIIGAKTLFWNNPNEGLLNSCGLIFDGFMQAYDRGFMEEDKGQYNTTEEIVAVSGCNMLLKAKMLKEIGAFYSPLQMYLEDLELCMRAKKSNYKIIYTANTTVGHKHMGSTSQNTDVRKRSKLAKNWLLIALKHYPLKSKLAMIKKYFLYKVFRKDS